MSLSGNPHFLKLFGIDPYATEITDDELKAQQRALLYYLEKCRKAKNFRAYMDIVKFSYILVGKRHSLKAREEGNKAIEEMITGADVDPADVEHYRPFLEIVAKQSDKSIIDVWCEANSHMPLLVDNSTEDSTIAMLQTETARDFLTRCVCENDLTNFNFILNHPGMLNVEKSDVFGINYILRVCAKNNNTHFMTLLLNKHPSGIPLDIERGKEIKNYRDATNKTALYYLAEHIAQGRAPLSPTQPSASLMFVTLCRRGATFGEKIDTPLGTFSQDQGEIKKPPSTRSTAAAGAIAASDPAMEMKEKMMTQLTQYFRPKIGNSFLDCCLPNAAVRFFAGTWNRTKACLSVAENAHSKLQAKETWSMVELAELWLGLKTNIKALAGPDGYNENGHFNIMFKLVNRDLIPNLNIVAPTLIPRLK